MSPDIADTEKLFSYGTLRDEAVQRATFGRRLASSADVLVGYRLRMIRIRDAAFVASSGAEYHRTLTHTGDASDRVDGAVLRLTPEELVQADAYEPAGYERTRVHLESGESAWLYVSDAG